jgi:hypothetical protein
LNTTPKLGLALPTATDMGDPSTFLNPSMNIIDNLAVSLTVMSFGATGDGVTDDKAAILLAEASAITNGGGITFPPGTYIVADSMTLTQLCIFQDKAILSVNTSKTVTVTGDIIGTGQIFTGAGTILFTGNRKLKEIPVEWFGGAGDYAGSGSGGTDNHLPFEKCATACATIGVTMRIKAGYYKTTDTITIPPFVSIKQDIGATIYLYGAADQAITCLEIGTSGSPNYYSTFEGLVVSKVTQSNYTADNIGIKFINLINSNGINIANVEYFTTGVQFYGYNAYNHIELGLLRYNKISIEGYATDNGAIEGLFSVNLFTKGRFSDTGITGVVLVKIHAASDAADLTCQNNVFESMTFESISTDNLAISIESGRANKFVNCYYECINTSIGIEVLPSANSQYNEFHFLCGSPVLDDTSDTNSSILSSPYSLLNAGPQLIFDSGDLPREVVHYDNGAYSSDKRWYFNRLHVATYGTNFSSRLGPTDYYNKIEAYQNYVDIVTDSINTHGLGFFVDTSEIKKFRLAPVIVSPPAVPYYVTIRAYDTNNTLLTSSDPNTPYVKTNASDSVAYSASNFVGWYFGGITGNDAIFSVGTDVKKIEVIIWNLSASLKINRLRLFTEGSNQNGRIPRVWIHGLSGSIDYPGHTLRSTFSPTRGFFDTGDRVNDVASSTVWVCTQRLDTTVKTNVSSGTSVDTTVNTSNLLADDIIGIMLDAGTIHWTSVASITDGDTIVINDAVPSLATALNAIYTMRWV